jgi:hypothetical protein
MIIITVSFITHLVNWYNNRLFPLIREFFLFQLKFIGLWITDTNVSPPSWIICVGIWPLPEDLYFCKYAVSCVLPTECIYVFHMTQLL